MLADGDTGSGGQPPGGTGRVWWDPPARQIYQPTGSGSNVNVTNASQLNTALTTATPGDCINLATGEYGSFVWGANSTFGHQSGTSGNPITVQAQAGASPTFTGTGTGNNADTLRLEDVDYFRISGIEVSNSQFNFRLFSCTFGEVRHCAIHDSGHANFVINDQSRITGSLDVGDPAHDILVEDCQVYNSGRILNPDLAADPDSVYGEAIYLGVGSVGQEWVHKPYNIEIRWCDIYNTIGDGVDIKPGCRNIYVHHNKFHDMDVPAGSVITHGPTAVPDTTIGVEKRIEIYQNRIWNIGHSNQQANQGSAYGIQCWLGGEKMWNNLLWGFADHGVNTRGVNIRGLTGGSVSGYSIDIYNNTIWTDYSISNVYNDGNPPTQNIDNNITADGRQGTQLVAGSVFTGTIPALHAESTATASGETEAGTAFTPATSLSVPAATTGLIATNDLTGLGRPIGQQTEQGALEYLA